MTHQLSNTVQQSKNAKISTSDRNILIAAKGGGITFIGGLIAAAAAFAFGVIAARLLGAHLFGVYTVTLTVTVFASGLTKLGLSGGLVRYIPMALVQKDNAKLWGVIQIGVALPTALSIVAGIIVFLLSPFISLKLFYEPALIPALRVMSVVIPLTTLMQVLATVTRSFKVMQYQVYAQDFLFYALKIPLTVGLVAFGLNLMGVLFAHIIAVASAMLLLLYFVNKLFPLNRPIQSAERHPRQLLKFSIPLYFSRLLGDFRGMFETLFLGLFGLVTGIGIYAAALRISSVGNIFFKSLKKVSMPLISELYSKGEIKQLEHIYQTITKWGVTFNLPVFLMIVLFGDTLLSIFGSEFTTGTLGLILLAAASLVNAGTGTCGSVISMSGHSRLSLANSIIFMLSTIAFDLLLIPSMGIAGAALASLITVSLVNGLRTVQVYRLLRILPYNLTFLKPIVAGTVAFIVAWLLNQTLFEAPGMWRMLIVLPVLWGGYILMILLLKLSDEDKLVLNKLRAKIPIGRVKRLSVGS